MGLDSIAILQVEMVLADSLVLSLQKQLKRMARIRTGRLQIPSAKEYLLAVED